MKNHKFKLGWVQTSFIHILTLNADCSLIHFGSRGPRTLLGISYWLILGCKTHSKKFETFKRKNINTFVSTIALQVNWDKSEKMKFHFMCINVNDVCGGKFGFMMWIAAFSYTHFELKITPLYIHQAPRPLKLWGFSIFFLLDNVSIWCIRAQRTMKRDANTFSESLSSLDSCLNAHVLKQHSIVNPTHYVLTRLSDRTRQLHWTNKFFSDLKHEEETWHHN